VKNLPAEEEIKARLRELTAQTRRVREELQELIRREPSSVRDFRDFSDDRSYKRKRSNNKKK
jgi:hypothetical protein